MNFIKRIITFQPSWTLRIVVGMVSVVAFISMCLITGVLDISGAMAERDEEFVGRNIEAGARVRASTASGQPCPMTASWASGTRPRRPSGKAPGSRRSVGRAA